MILLTVLASIATYYFGGWFLIEVWEGWRKAADEKRYFDNCNRPPVAVAAIVWPILIVVWFVIATFRKACSITEGLSSAEWVGAKLYKLAHRLPKPKTAHLIGSDNFRENIRCSNCDSTIIIDRDTVTEGDE